jgi:hypothetical protein
MIDHGALTDLVLAHLQAQMAANPDVTAGKVPPVGDGAAPTEGGWADGQAGTGIFVPYVVLVSGGAAPFALDPGSSTPTWAVGWSLRSFGGSRKQCDWMATVAREAIGGLKKETFGTPEVWKVINTQWVSLGPVARNDSTAPPSWSVFDTVNLVADQAIR